MQCPRTGLCAAIVMLVGAVVTSVGAAQPKRGQILDALTGRPVEGAVVVALWHRYPLGDMTPCLGRTGYDSHAEFITDGDGRYTVPGKLDLMAPLRCPLQDPQLLIYKGKYGPWRVQNPREIDKGALPIVVLWSLRTVEERLAYMRGEMRHKDFPTPPDPITSWVATSGPDHPPLPNEAIPRYMAAVDAERIQLGLLPFFIDVPLWLEREGSR